MNTMRSLKIELGASGTLDAINVREESGDGTVFVRCDDDTTVIALAYSWDVDGLTVSPADDTEDGAELADAVHNALIAQWDADHDAEYGWMRAAVRSGMRNPFALVTDEEHQRAWREKHGMVRE